MGVEQHARHQRSRRGFLSSAVGVSAGITVGRFGNILDTPAAEAAADDVATIVTLVTAAEILAVTFDYTAITSATFAISRSAVDHLKGALGVELSQLQTLRLLGGVSRTQQCTL